MINLLNSIRTPNRQIPFSKALFDTILITGAGVLLGVVAKLLDIYTSNLGNIFSQMSVWIFLCTVVSVLSSTPLRAAVNVFLFCIGMLWSLFLLPCFLPTPLFFMSLGSLPFFRCFRSFFLLFQLLYDTT